jgi:chemotaxis protein MotB
MAKKKGGGGGGHGGGWFVTFADLMALLMSFFVMVAAYSSQDQKKLQIVAGSMRDAFGTNKDSRYAGIIEKDGLPTKPYLRNADPTASPEEASDFTAPTMRKTADTGSEVVRFNRAFGLAAASLRQALQEMPDIAELSRNVIIEETKEGLNISLVDMDGRSMFPENSMQPYERTRKLLEALAPNIRKMPNRISVTGHTAAPRPGTRAPEPPWTLSSGRAVTVREILAASGIPDDRFSVVSGRGDTEPMFPDNPYLPANRRVTITLLNEAPPLPFSQKP